MDINFGNEDPGVMFRFENPETGQRVVVMAAPEAAMDNDDGPVLIQLAEDNMVVLFNERFVSEKFERAIERNRDEFDEATVVAMAMTNLIQTALLAASKKFEEDSSSKN